MHMACKTSRFGNLFSIVVFCCLPISQPVLASSPQSMQWLLSYENASTNDIQDRRLQGLIRTRTPAYMSKKLGLALGGPPDPVTIAEGRYVSMAACRPHSCIEKGFFWIDTRTGIGLGAFAEPDALLLGSNGLTSKNIPPAARRALIDWITEHGLASRSVQFIGRDGARIALDTSAFQPRQSYQPSPGGPSFDCTSAGSRIAEAICKDAGLSKQDLDLARLADDIWRGHSTVHARQQLMERQNTWRQSRDAQCASSQELASCLAGRYREQHEVLMNWIPALPPRPPQSLQMETP